MAESTRSGNFDHLREKQFELPDLFPIGPEPDVWDIRKLFCPGEMSLTYDPGFTSNGRACGKHDHLH